MRPIWKGSVSFGLINIPIALFTATRREELKFRLLRKDDLSPVNYKRVAEVDGKEVPWDQIVKGYEYEKGRFVVLKEEDFRRVDVEATETVDIIDFVDLDDVDPMHFMRPYYLEPQKSGAKAYALLRDALRESNKVGITKVVIRTRQHLAALKAHGDLLVLELMHFADELVEADELKTPPATAKATKRELTMARNLINEMTVAWDASRYTDDYRSALLELIKTKVKSGGKKAPGAKKKRQPSGDVIDFVAALKESLEETGRGRTKRKRAKTPGKGKKKRKAAA